ncbi:MAG: inosine-5-monophosphate dehydrogenase [Kaistia sp. SCN 65-12]|nr:MAG: inosine-5-monophosphate dehydrogenase [Kaistia sp. SCN 65-12]
MRVSEAMTRDVCVVRPDHTIEEAARMMLAIDAGLLPVGADDRLLGMITDRDIAVRAIAEGRGPTTPVGDVMTQDVKYCFIDEDTAHVAKNMGEQQIRRLPVIDRDKRLVGILSLADVASHEADGRRVGNAYRDIAQPGGEHNQGAEARGRGM